MKNRFTLLIVLLLFTLKSFANNSSQLIENIEKIPSISGDVQIWSIVSDRSGRTFYSSGENIFLYNGTTWRTYSTPQSHYFRSLWYDNQSDRIYAAGNYTFGYWNRDSFGHYQYTELKSSDEIFWRVISRDDKVYFQSHKSVFCWNSADGSVSRLPTQGYVGYLHHIEQGKRIAVQIDEHFYWIEGNNLELIAQLQFQDRASYIGIIDQAFYIVGENSGLFRFQNELEAIGSDELDRLLENNRIFSATSLGDSVLALGTVVDGLYLVDTQGSVINTHNEDSGLEHTTVLSLAVGENCIWLGLDGGIARLETSTQESYIVSKQPKIGDVYSSYWLNDSTLYLGTNKGLYRYNPISDNTPEMVDQLQGQVWRIKRIGEHLLVCHDHAFFEIEPNGTLSRLDDAKWDVGEIPGQEHLFWASDAEGLHIFEIVEGKISHRNKVEGYLTPNTSVMVDVYGYYWIDGRDNLRRFQLDKDLRSVVAIKDYSLEGGKNGWNSIAMIDNDILFFKNNQGYRYDVVNDSLVLNEHYTALLSAGGGPVTTISQHDNTFLYISGLHTGILERNGQEFRHKGYIFKQTPSQMIPVPFRKIAIENSKAYMGFKNGLAIYDLKQTTSPPSNIYLDKLEYTYMGETITSDISDISKAIDLPNGVVHIRLDVANLSQMGMIYISVNGEPWEVQRVDGSINFDYLEDGIHSISITQNLAEEPLKVVLDIEPSFYKRPLYLASFALFILGIIVLFYYINRIRLQRIKRRYQEHRDHLVERERMRFENLTLAREVEDRDKRLTNFAMNNIHYNNTLANIEKEVVKIPLDDMAVRSLVNGIIQKIKAYRHSEENWKIFEKHFNGVYKGFFERILAHHPHLTNNDLKIAAYIRLGLSTKEMASLMNISSGSVDTARHRLRRHVNLDSGASLTSYIISITSQDPQ